MIEAQETKIPQSALIIHILIHSESGNSKQYCTFKYEFHHSDLIT